MRSLWVTLLLFGCARPELGEPSDERTLSLEDYAESRERAWKAAEQFERLTELHPVIGTVCYYGGTPPSGRLEMELLVEMGRVDLLRRLLEAPTLEARLYAAIGLSRLGVMNLDELQAFAGTMDRPLRVCSGCIEQEVSAQKALEYYDANPSYGRHLELKLDEPFSVDRQGSVMGL